MRMAGGCSKGGRLKSDRVVVWGRDKIACSLRRRRGCGESASVPHLRYIMEVVCSYSRDGWDYWSYYWFVGSDL